MDVWTHVRYMYMYMSIRINGLRADIKLAVGLGRRFCNRLLKFRLGSLVIFVAPSNPRSPTILAISH